MTGMPDPLSLLHTFTASSKVWEFRSVCWTKRGFSFFFFFLSAHASGFLICSPGKICDQGATRRRGFPGGTNRSILAKLPLSLHATLAFRNQNSFSSDWNFATRRLLLQIPIVTVIMAVTGLSLFRNYYHSPPDPVVLKTPRVCAQLLVRGESGATAVAAVRSCKPSRSQTCRVCLLGEPKATSRLYIFGSMVFSFPRNFQPLFHGRWHSQRDREPVVAAGRF